jgi:hypothetical protein
MPGASKETHRVKNLNANWKPAGAGKDGQFEFKIITDDDKEYALPVSAASAAAVVALAKADTVLAWDPVNHVLIVANIVGTMPWTAADRS